VRLVRQTDLLCGAAFSRACGLPKLAMLLAVGTVVSGVLVAGCGASSGSPPTSASSSGSTSPSAHGSGPLAFSECMRANGVPNFPDLSGNGIRIGAHGQTVSVNGVSVNAPAFVAARQKCERYMPHIDASPAQTAQQMRRGLQFARCMRSHGAPNFPDPKVTTGQGGNQEAYLPGVNLQSPAVQSAAKACGGGPKGP
jgi:hypothetical protein